MPLSQPRAPIRLASCESAMPIAKAVARLLDTQLVATREFWFACGEGKFVFEENIRGSDLYIFQDPMTSVEGLSPYDRTMMALHAIDAAVLADVEHVTAILPYFPGARQDKRKGRTREGISASLFARCFQAAGASRIVTLEIHNEAIAGMFEPRRCSLENLELHTALSPWLASRGLVGDVVASPDVGGLERARAYAADLDHNLVMLSKVRDYRTANRVVESILIGDVTDKNVLLVDDIVDTGGSVVAAVEQLKGGGARDIIVTCAHPVFSGPAWERFEKLAAQAKAEGWSFQMVGTNAIHHESTPSWYHAFDIAPLLARVIASVNHRDSVTGAHAGL